MVKLRTTIRHSMENLEKIIEEYIRRLRNVITQFKEIFCKLGYNYIS